MTGLELVALCDTWEERLQQAGERLGVATYVDYERFLEHDMDAVILANYFHQHAPFAMQALRAGKHVMSETAACHTLGEGVALVEAVEKSGLTYMFAENYPYMAFNQQMRCLYQKGTVGEFRYGEGEYVHPDPATVKLARSCGFDQRHRRHHYLPHGQWRRAQVAARSPARSRQFRAHSRQSRSDGELPPRRQATPARLARTLGETQG